MRAVRREKQGQDILYLHLDGPGGCSKFSGDFACSPLSFFKQLKVFNHARLECESRDGLDVVHLPFELHPLAACMDGANRAAQFGMARLVQEIAAHAPGRLSPAEIGLISRTSGQWPMTSLAIRQHRR